MSDDSYTHGTSEFDDRILNEPDARWPVMPGRYRLVASLACPWATRAVIVRRLLGLEHSISLAIVDPIQDERSWRFTLDPGGVDSVLDIAFLHEAYDARRTDYSNGVSVPAIVDVPSGELVTNAFSQITLDFSTQWRDHHRKGAPDLYPEQWRDELDTVMSRVYTDLNDAVYGAGFARSQRAYGHAYGKVFDCLDWLSARLRERRYLVGDHITEADVRAFTTLVRFDTVYHGHFKCNRNKLSEDPVLDAYLLDLMQTPGFGDTVNQAHIKHHYHQVHTDLNPSRIVPYGPRQNWARPHHRELLGGTPFGDGTPPTLASDLADYRWNAGEVLASR
jgi:putative glutathione S-transferase